MPWGGAADHRTIDLVLQRKLSNSRAGHSVTLTGIGFSLVFPSLGVEALKRVALQSRGMAVAGFIAFLDISLGLSGPLMGLVIAIGGFGPVFLGGAVASVAALTIATTMARG